MHDNENIFYACICGYIASYGVKIIMRSSDSLSKLSFVIVLILNHLNSIYPNLASSYLVCTYKDTMIYYAL